MRRETGDRAAQRRRKRYTTSSSRLVLQQVFLERKTRRKETASPNKKEDPVCVPLESPQESTDRERHRQSSVADTSQSRM